MYLHGLDVVATDDVDLDGHCGRHLLHSHTSSLGLQTSSLTLSLSLSVPPPTILATKLQRTIVTRTSKTTENLLSRSYAVERSEHTVRMGVGGLGK